jgi:hypothetical protein
MDRETVKILVAGLLFLIAMLLATAARADHNPYYVYPEDPEVECNVGDFKVHGGDGTTFSCQDGVWTVMLTLETAEDKMDSAALGGGLVGLLVGLTLGIYGHNAYLRWRILQ